MASDGLEMPISEETRNIASNGTGSSLVTIDELENGIIHLSLGKPDEAVVTLTEARIEALERVLAQLKDLRPKGVIVTGPHADMFTVGADISLIQSVTESSLGAALAKKGQQVFSRLEDLQCPTVAAISGPCVGGGYELALCCTYRIASERKSTLIGLPEVKLGIIPGFGGSQRLPRLIGLPRALELICAGKTLRAAQAKAQGLIDEVVPFDELLTRAQEILIGKAPITRRPWSLMEKLATTTSLGRSIVRRVTEKKVKAETKGFYPAPLAALEATVNGLKENLTAGLAQEARLLGQMIVTPESKSLVKIFLLSEAAKSIGKSAKKEVDSLAVLVIGAGIMGAGIAAAMARNGIPVLLKDTDASAVDRALSHVRSDIQGLRYLSDKEKERILSQVEGTTRGYQEITNVNFAIEAIVEKMEVKKQVLGEVARMMPPGSLITSNTSSLSVTEMATALPSPERVVGMHFFNPVEKMPLVEIVRGKDTTPRTIALTAALAVKLGKSPIIVEDVPGFLVNRILCPYLNTAATLLSDGHALQDIENAAIKFGMPMGPFRLLDEVGLDVAQHVEEILFSAYGDRMKEPGYLKVLLGKGRKGRKSGLGFYRYEEGKPLPDPELSTILGLPKLERRQVPWEILAEGLICTLINEAVRCFDEGVAGMPSKEAAGQIDLGSVMGFGFPPFKGGVLHYAESLGVQRVLSILQSLQERYGSQFAPAPGIIERAKQGRKFV